MKNEARNALLRLLVTQGPAVLSDRTAPSVLAGLVKARLIACSKQEGERLTRYELTDLGFEKASGRPREVRYLTTQEYEAFESLPEGGGMVNEILAPALRACGFIREGMSGWCTWTEYGRKIRARVGKV